MPTYAETLLSDILSPEKTPRVPKAIRDRAKMVLRRYPNQWDMDRVCEMKANDLFENPFKRT